MPAYRTVAIAMTLVLFSPLFGATTASAQGFGSFALCYERLKQLVDLLRAQGQSVKEIIDEPRNKQYVVTTTFGAHERIMSCTAKGDLLVVDD